jgi:hypothetical protein
MNRFACLAALELALWAAPLAIRASESKSQLGREVAMTKHLADDEEFRMPLTDLIAWGKKIFCANWTEQEGGGRPLVKGNGKVLSDPANPLVGARAFNRISAPDSNSCSGCHNAPYGIPGGGGDFVTNVFVQAQRFDFATFDPKDHIRTKGTLTEQMEPASLSTIGNMRSTTGLFGAGYLEMVARQMTADLQAIRDSLKLGESKRLVSKGIDFGVIARSSGGLWDASRVEGLPHASVISAGAHDPPSLVIRPWSQAGNVVSIREFTNTAMNQHHGIQTTERFGVDTDLDGDGFVNELTRADVTAVTLFQATLQVPGRVIPNDPEVEQAVLAGEKMFKRIGCASCHVPELPLDKEGWIFTEPNPYNPPTNLRVGETRTIRMDLTASHLPQPRLKPGSDGVVAVRAFTDFKLHDISDPNDPNAEPLDMNEVPWSPKFRAGNQKFLTKRLWGAANEPPYFHNGLFTTMRQAVLAHSGEALKSRQAFQQAPADDQNALIEFLKTLQVLPPGTTDLVVDENYRPKRWPHL